MITDDFSKIPMKLLVTSLRSTVCPSCSRGKQSGQTLCRPCWAQLKPAIGVSLYQRVGKGYEQAFSNAMKALMVTTLHFPGCRRIAPAAYDAEDESLHIDVGEMLHILNTADTPANRDAAAKVAEHLVRSLYPGIAVTTV
jgi:hypothetical protein